MHTQDRPAASQHQLYNAYYAQQCKTFMKCIYHQANRS